MITDITAVTSDVPAPTPDACDPTVRPDEIEVGQWYWVTTKSGDEDVTWYGCVTHLGSNYALLEEPARKGASREYHRIHFDDFYDHCVWDSNATRTITHWTSHHNGRLRALMGRMQEVTQRLAIGPQRELAGSTSDAQALSTTLSGQSYGDYKGALVKAQKEELPAIFKEIEAEHEQLAKWMCAELLPLKAKVTPLVTLTKSIESRVFNVELYAGLIEKIVEVRDGEPAAIDEPLTMLQRRHYMDEECLARYRTGGMQFKHLEEFDTWIAEDENMRRLLPFPRCMVAFRVRRYDIERACGSIAAYIQLSWEREQDRKTYLYIRNGDRLYRLSTGVDFGVHLFPDFDHDILASGKKLWAIHRYSKVSQLITDDDYQERKRAKAQQKRDVQQRYRDLMKESCTCVFHPVAESGKDEEDCEDKPVPKRHVQEWCDACEQLTGWNMRFGGPHVPERECRQSLDEYLRDHYKEDSNHYAPFDKSSVWYDDVCEYVKDRMDSHNRIALVVQGLLDRSPVLHPHPPWRIWTPEGYQQALRLIYDDDRALTTGDAPDFEAYRRRLNATLKAGCVTVGQRAVWEQKRRDDREEDRHHSKTWWADGGPERVHEVKRVRDGVCVYEYNRKSQRGKKRWVPNPNRPGWGHDTYDYDNVTQRSEAAVDEVLNVTAYVPGDFKQFFADPRTRAQYVRWALYLLAAEEWHAQNGGTGVPEEQEGVTCSNCGQPANDNPCETCGHKKECV